MSVTPYFSFAPWSTNLYRDVIGTVYLVMPHHQPSLLVKIEAHLGIFTFIGSGVKNQLSFNWNYKEAEVQKLCDWLMGTNFEFWAQATKLVVRDPAGVLTTDAEYALNTKQECDECYGTRFKKGWGAPCSKGCK